jgi:predicted esterase
MDYWSSSTELGFALALPQSSQTTSWDTYTWNDLEVGRRELLQHMAKLRDDGLLQDDGLVLGGFSGGARLALISMLKDEARPSGFILMAPWLPELEDWGPMFSGLAGRDLRGFIICGEEDEQCLGNAIKASEMLNRAGVDTDLQVVEGLDHDFPDDFESRLADMLVILR